MSNHFTLRLAAAMNLADSIAIKLETANVPNSVRTMLRDGLMMDRNGLYMMSWPEDMGWLDVTERHLEEVDSWLENLAPTVS